MLEAKCDVRAATMLLNFPKYYVTKSQIPPISENSWVAMLVSLVRQLEHRWHGVNTHTHTHTRRYHAIFFPCKVK